MSEVSEAYSLTETLHSHFFDDTENLNRGIIRSGEVRADISEPYRTKRLTIFGEIEGRGAYQTLSKSQRNGAFYLSTVFTEPAGEALTTRITESSPVTVTKVIESTLFMRAFLYASQDGS